MILIPPAILVRWVEAQRVVGDLEFDVPALVVDAVFGFPDAVPRIVIAVVVAHGAVVERTTGIYLEEITRLMVVVWVETDLHPVGVGVVVAAH